jgi:predicted Zn-dependent protease
MDGCSPPAGILHLPPSTPFGTRHDLRDTDDGIRDVHPRSRAARGRVHGDGPRMKKRRLTLRRRILPRRRRRLRPVELIPAGGADRALLEALGRDLQAELGVQWCIGDAMELRDEWRDAQSGQYRSIHLMHTLMDGARRGGRGQARRWRLAIAEAGLCADGVGSIFGEAAVEGCCAVVGLVPLRAGSGADAGVLRSRLLTEAVHELGHLAGLRHCGRASCVMYPSRHIADSDHKQHAFCPECRPSLKLRALQET